MSRWGVGPEWEVKKVTRKKRGHDDAIRAALMALDAGDPGPARQLLSRRLNAFEALCALAAQEQWCWNLSCGTCGHGVFRWGLRALAQGHRPADPTWSVHWGAGVAFADLEVQNGPQPPNPGDWPARDQERLQRIVARATLTNIAAVAAFPDWLGYIGLALFYTEQAEAKRALITRALGPQLRAFVVEGSPGASWLTDLADAPDARLRWADLSRIQASWRHPPEANG
jgi:hypothetical protein